MNSLFTRGSGSAGQARDENDKAATSIASPEMATRYFRRLRLDNVGAIVSFLLLFAVGIPITQLHGAFWRIGGAVLIFGVSLFVRLASGYFFRCPACDYQFQTSPWFTEPKWHTCPACHTQFTAEPKLRSPAL
jgi:hypothetical protein